MSDRREPTISALSLEKDESQRARAQAALNQNSRARPMPVSERPVIIRSGSATMALVLVLACGAFSGFIFWQLQQTQLTLNASQAALSAAELRVTELEKRLVITGDESSQSMTALQANIKEAASEVQKIWGVLNGKNRNALVSLEQKASALEKSVGGFDAKIHSALDEKIKASVSEILGEVKVLSELMDAQQQSISSTEQTAKNQTKSLEALKKKFERLDSDLRGRIQVNEEAIRSIDAFRVQVNRQLMELKGG
jgi:hypothetical protein